MAEVVQIITSDGVYFNVAENIARLSPKLVVLLETPNRPDIIELLMVNSNVLKLVLDWLAHHKYNTSLKNPANSKDDDWKATKDPNSKIDSWDQKFLSEQDPGTLFELVMAASYLEIKVLLDLTIQRVYEQMRPDLTPEQIRQNFGIAQSDLTAQELECIQKENEWCMENKNAN